MIMGGGPSQHPVHTVGTQ